MTERDIDPELLELEVEMHEGFTPWIASQSERHEGGIVDVGYHPEKYALQRIDVFTSPSIIKSRQLQPAGVLAELDNQFAKFVGYANARKYIKTFLDARAFEDSDQRLVDAVADYLDDGKSVGLLSDHAEDLFDIAKGQAALSLAINRAHGPDYAARFRAWVNKLMTREEIKGHGYMPDSLSMMGDIRWVIPDSQSAENYIPNERIRSVVNRGALRSFAEDKKNGEGTVEVIVPAGSQMRPIKGSNGAPETLIAPNFSEASVNLLTHLDALIVFSSWSGQATVSNLVELSFESRSDRDDRAAKVAQEIRELMRKQTEEVSGLRVVLAEEFEAAV